MLDRVSITGRSVKKDEFLFNSQVRLQTRIEPGKLENYGNKKQECNEDVFQNEFHSELGILVNRSPHSVNLTRYLKFVRKK